MSDQVIELMGQALVPPELVNLMGCQPEEVLIVSPCERPHIEWIFRRKKMKYDQRRRGYTVRICARAANETWVIFEEGDHWVDFIGKLGSISEAVSAYHAHQRDAEKKIKLRRANAR